MKTKRKTGAPRRHIGAPFLHRVTSLPEQLDPTHHPFDIRAFSQGIDLAFRSKVTFFVGENQIHPFISLFANRFEQGIYILDEPEAALSPQRQLTFLKIIHDLAASGQAQFLIATHSPILLTYPGAVLFSLDGEAIREIDYRETPHVLITRDFLNSPERFFKHLFTPDSAS